MEEYKRYFEVLELDTNASLPDVRRAYLHLKELYSTESIVTHPILDEFSDDNRQDILDQIEDAHMKLTEYFNNQSAESEEERMASMIVKTVDKEFDQILYFTGPILKQIRERVGIELSDLSLATKVRAQYLECIELEKFASLPHEVYTRGFVIDYARYLQLDPERVARDYMSRYRAWKEKR